MESARASVLGAGSWGTSLGILLARKGIDVVLIDPDPGVAARMESDRENANFLPGFLFPPTLHVMYDIPRAVEGRTAVVLAVPSQAFREVAAKIPAGVPSGADWVIATKGLEEGSGLRMSEVLTQVRPDASMCVLAGPSLAREVVSGHPTTVLAASDDPALAARVRDLFHGPTFRVYTSSDVRGVEIGTALKNVVALAAGILDGMGLGANAKGALLTRGLAEMTRLGVALGARRETFLGLAGVGDLVTTCSSPLSRNRSLGEAIGRGIPVQEAIAGMTQVAEGVPTTRSAVALGRRLGIELPIAEQVARILFEGVDPHEALRALMARPPRTEEEAG
jgi:glycerol-3-phosphate dehydrogenase (NAD(P)+)